MIYFTDNRDTAASVAAKFSGGNNASLADKIRSANADTRANRAMPGEFYAPRQPINIPIYWDQKKDDGHFQKRVIQRIEHFTPEARANLARAQKEGHDLNHIGFAHQAIQKANRATEDPSIGLVIANAAYHTLDAAADIKKDRVSDFDKVLQDIKGHLKNIANATTKDARAVARSAFGKSLDSLNKEYQYELEEFELKGNLLLRKPFKAIKTLNANGWEVFDEQILDDVEHAANALKFLGWGALAFDGLDGAFETYETYKNGGDWIKEATKESFDILTYIGVGLAVGLAFTPVGWVAILTTAAFTSATGYLLENQVINPYIERHIS